MNTLFFKSFLLFLPLSFFPIFRFNEIPLCFIFLFFYVILTKVNFINLKKNKPFIVYTKIYLLYTIASLPVIFFSIYNIPSSIKTIAYTIIPLIVLIFYTDFINQYHFHAKFLLIGIFIVVIFGWLFKYNILSPMLFFPESKQAEVDIGYWGIRYMISSRNADYIYPIIGSILSFKLLQNNFYKNIFVLFFLLTAVLSQSRGAFIISVTHILIMIFSDNKFKDSKYLLIIFTLLVFFIPNLVDLNFLESLIDSIFKIDKTSTFSNYERANILSLTLDKFLSHPFGLGIDCFYLDTTGARSAENAFLTILVERGFLPGILFLLMLFKMLKDSFYSKSKALLLFSSSIFVYLIFNYELNNFFMNAILLIAICESKNKNRVIV